MLPAYAGMIPEIPCASHSSRGAPRIRGDDPVPPSGADFAASGYRDYAFGLVVLHNGEVYKYKHGNIPFLARGFDDCVERQRQKGYNEKEAFEIAMKEYSDRFGITWEKIQ